MPLRLRFACLTALSVVLGGVAVLTLNYVLLQERLGPSIERVPFTDIEGPNDNPLVQPRRGLSERPPVGSEPAPKEAPADGGPVLVPGPEGQQVEATSEEAVLLQRRFEQAALRSVLAQSIVALSVTAVAALAVAWLVAGRYLTPIRALTGTARELSESTLHRRIRHVGPKDEVHDLADSFDRMLDRLERAFEAQRRFIANASHELRTPITMSRTAMEVLGAKQNPTSEQVSSAVATVVTASERSERSIAGLLALARADQGLDRRQRVDLGALIQVVVDARRDLAAAAGVAVHAGGTAGIGGGDPALLETLVGNLVDNAIKYNQRGGWVRVVLKQAPGAVKLHIENTGEQLPPGAEDWIFEPFRRAHGDRVAGRSGSGLGLAIVQSIADAHGGGVTARTRPEGGLLVVVTLPTGPVTSAVTTHEAADSSSR